MQTGSSGGQPGALFHLGEGELLRTLEGGNKEEWEREKQGNTVYRLSATLVIFSDTPI